MDKPPVRKYFDQLRFVFLFFFVFYVSLLLLDCLAVSYGRREISFLLFNIIGAKHGRMPKPTSFSETVGCPIKANDIINQTGACNIPISVVDNHTKKIVPAAYGEGNRREQMSPPDHVIRDNVELVMELTKTNLNPCSGQYIYVHDLPSKFNEDLLKGCQSLSKWMDMCPYMANSGLGPKVTEKSNRDKVLLKGSWYATNQFTLEVIFHNTMKHHKCLTNNSSLASAIYAPYYAGLDVGQYLWGFNTSVRDASPKELVKWLARQPEWETMWGRDHFMVAGRIGWDFRRRTENGSEAWGTKLMFLPEASNMSLLPIESGSHDNDFPIPYPTYFHPSEDVEVLKWQKRMRIVKRPYLFSFAGAPRPNSTFSIRSELIKHCQSSKSCKLLNCLSNEYNCDDPVDVIKVFRSSVFCLQPPGDSFTRRSTFDSILAGCIPVFFDPRSAYDQYLWHFPKRRSSYSVCIPEGDVKDKRVMINETLSRVRESEVLAMRKEVIRLIPRIIYGNPSSRLNTFEDAFDIAVKGILGRIETIRREVANAKYFDGGFANQNNTKSYNSTGDEDAG